MSYFFRKFELKNNIRTCRKIEEWIAKYSIQLFNYNTSTDVDEHFLLRKDFDDLVNDIKQINVSRNYLGLFSWLIDRAFMITPNILSTKKQITTTLNKNKSILIKVLYDVNSSNLLKCFSKNCAK